MTKNEIVELVISQVENLNNSLDISDKIVVTPQTILFGTNSSIDSLSLVSVVVDLEMFLSDHIGKEISLTDDRAMTREISPFDSITTLADYIYEIINS